MGTIAVDDPCPNCGSDNFAEPNVDPDGIYHWFCRDCKLELDDLEWLEALNYIEGVIND